MKRNNGNHPTPLNLDSISSKNSTKDQPIFSPATLSAKWAAFIDPSKIPANWAYWETPNGNILDWGKYPDFEKYSRKDKAKHSHRFTSVESSVSTKTETKAPKLSSIPVRKDKVSEKAKYDFILNTKAKDQNEIEGTTPRKQIQIKSSMKPTYGRPPHTPKKVRFEDEIRYATKPSKLKRTVLTLKSLTTRLPSPHAIKFSTMATTKVRTDKTQRYLTNNAIPDFCPTPTTPEYSWFDPVNFRPVYVYADGRQRADMMHAPSRTMRFV